jgi:PEGA domain
MRRLAQVLAVWWCAALALAPAATAQAVAPPPASSAPASAPPAPSPAPPAPTVEVDAPEHALTQKIAVWRFDALGIEPALVAQLEALFRSELDRLAASPLPSRREIERKIPEPLASCTGEAKCLAAIGKRLGVEVMVAGSVGALGDNYLLDIKVVDVATAKQLRRITTDPLRGTPDELIESVRVAAYRLLAPEQLHGSIAILSDLIGGEVAIDGKRVGQTPLPAPISKLALGPHTVRVSARGYVPFEEKVEVRFQKSARVEVRLVVDLAAGPPPPLPTKAEPQRWYSRTWVMVAIGVGAVVTGAIIGSQLAEVDRQCVNC